MQKQIFAKFFYTFPCYRRLYLDLLGSKMADRNMNNFACVCVCVCVFVSEMRGLFLYLGQLNMIRLNLWFDWLLLNVQVNQLTTTTEAV